jgi:hypothetical protein
MKKTQVKQWLWFIGLYAGSLSTVLALSYAIRLISYYAK